MGALGVPRLMCLLSKEDITNSLSGQEPMDALGGIDNIGDIEIRLVFRLCR